MNESVSLEFGTPSFDICKVYIFLIYGFYMTFRLR